MNGLFGLHDAIFSVAYMVIILWVGFAVARREKATVNDYFRAGNTLRWYAIGASIVAAGISSEQFVGEVGYAYKLGMPVFNWEWLIFPAISILLLIFVPIYVRNRITTMPEYLEKRYGPHSRTIYALLIIISYIFVNFALVFYTGGYAMEKMWGVNRVLSVWVLAILTGAYTIYGGMLSVAWTSFVQCLLLLGGGLYVFFAGMHHIGWDLSAMLGTGQRAHLFAPQGHEVPWTSLVILALSTNVWYYATDQFINQRVLGAKNEWQAKMGVLFAGGLQLLIPLATCGPGLVYYVMNPNLADHNAAYPNVVAALVPAALRGLVVAAILGAVMSTISGLVNSTSTMLTLDIFHRWKGKDWPEGKLVRFGKWTGAGALVVGALFAPVVMKWESIFRYCQDIWGPMAAPAAVVFLGGALWKPARERAAVACLILSIVSVPFTFLKLYLSDSGIVMLPPNLDNALVFSCGVFMLSVVMLITFSLMKSVLGATLVSGVLGVFIFWLVNLNPAIVAILILVSFISAIGYYGSRAKRGTVKAGMWDQSMLRLPKGETEKWYTSIWFWWPILAAILIAIYVKFA